MTKKKVINSDIIVSEEKNKSLNFLYFLSFIEGAIVIFIELLGAKMLQAFYGTSLLVWSVIIGVTISSLTLGYFLGGKLSTRRNKVKLLAILFAISAFFIAIMPNFVLGFFQKYSENDLFYATLYSTILLIAPAIISLGATTPIIIQLISEKNNQSGKAAGNTYATSTLAGIIATMLLGYYILPSFGSSSAILIGTLILILFSFLISFTKVAIISIILILFSAFQTLKTKETDKNFVTIFKSEGLMGQLKVVDHNFPAYNIEYRILFVNGIAQTIIYNTPKAKSFWDYAYRISSLASLKKGKKALLIGMGGGAIAQELQALNFKLDIVDIDNRMYNIAQNFFYFKPSKKTHFQEDDARHFVKLCKKKYDIIMIDVCSGEVQPTNLFTNESIKEIKKILNKDGIILIQYQEKIDLSKISGSQSIAKTFISNGFKAYQNIEKLEVSGIVLAFSKSKIPFEKIDTTSFTMNCKNLPWMKNYLKKPFDPILKPLKNSILLTDDKPILEKINSETIEIWRRSMIKYYGNKLIM